MKNPRLITISARAPEHFVEVLAKFMQRGSYVSPSDLIRDALREKIRREAPDLYEKLCTSAPAEAPTQ
jgi:Arc/MetJ-type ribon-helix-helix transcriptional regulator